MIQLKEVYAIHDILVERFGGTKGTRDPGALEAAIARPYQTFDSKELYPEPEDKAAAAFESIIKNHPFIDGNKRTAYVIMRLILKESGKDLEAQEEDKYTFVMNAVSGRMTFEQIREWINERVR